MDTCLKIDLLKKVRQANVFVESPYAQEFTAQELKLFEVSISECRSDDIELFKKKNDKEFSFTAKKLAMLLNTSVSVISQSADRLSSSIMKKYISQKVIDENGNVEFEKIGIMPFAKYKNGVFVFHLNYRLLPYFIEINKNFTEYQLRHLLSMNGAYPMKLYKLLYQYKNIGKRTFTIEDLKEQFGIIDSYALYKHFKSRVINFSLKEINAKTDLNVEYSEIKLGRKVEKLEFKFYVKKENEEINKQPKQLIVDNIEPAILDKDLQKVLGAKADEISDKTKCLLTKLIINKGIDFVKCSINYAKKHAKTNFEKYLLDTIENNWAEVDIQKLESKRQTEEIDKQKKLAEFNAENQQLELDNANKSEIEHLFFKLTDFEQSRYSNLATNILNKNATKLKHITIAALSYSIYAVTNGRYYDKKTEIFISKFLNTSLNINDYIVS